MNTVLVQDIMITTFYRLKFDLPIRVLTKPEFGLKGPCLIAQIAYPNGRQMLYSDECLSLDNLQLPMRVGHRKERIEH